MTVCMRRFAIPYEGRARLLDTQPRNDRSLYISAGPPRQRILRGLHERDKCFGISRRPCTCLDRPPQRGSRPRPPHGHPDPGPLPLRLSSWLNAFLIMKVDRSRLGMTRSMTAGSPQRRNPRSAFPPGGCRTCRKSAGLAHWAFQAFPLRARILCSDIRTKA